MPPDAIPDTVPAGAPAVAATAPDLLRLEDVSASYRGLKALQHVDVGVRAGEIVAIIGANGAGKTTLLRSIAGQVATEGRITFDGESLVRVAPHLIARRGIGLVPEGRRLFPRLSVEDNLRLGAYAKRGTPDRFKPLDLVFDLFPRLHERLTQRAETLSGGEQQMLAIGRALMIQPRLLMLDEPSQGIAPQARRRHLRRGGQDPGRSASPYCWWSSGSPRRSTSPTGPTCCRPAAS